MGKRMSPEARAALEAAERTAPRNGPYWERDAYMFAAGCAYQRKRDAQVCQTLKWEPSKGLSQYDDGWIDGANGCADAIERRDHD